MIAGKLLIGESAKLGKGRSSRQRGQWEESRTSEAWWSSEAGN